MTIFADCNELIRKAERAEREGRSQEARYFRYLAEVCFEKYTVAYRDILKINVPNPELIDEEKTADLNNQLALNPKIAYEISSGLAKGFENVKIDAGKTFAAVLFIIEKPRFTGQVINEVGGKLQFSYITEPEIMKSAGNRIKQEIIK
jgi:hypothetical protein